MLQTFSMCFITKVTLTNVCPNCTHFSQLRKMQSSLQDTTRHFWWVNYLTCLNRHGSIWVIHPGIYFSIMFTSIRQLPLPLLRLSSTPNLSTVILSTINSLCLNYPVSSRSRTLLLVLSLKVLSPVISLPWIQVLLTYLQRSQNYPTSVPS